MPIKYAGTITTISRDWVHHGATHRYFKVNHTGMSNGYSEALDELKGPHI